MLLYPREGRQLVFEPKVHGTKFICFRPLWESERTDTVVKADVGNGRSLRCTIGET